MPIVVHQDYQHHIPDLVPTAEYGPHLVFADKDFAAMPQGLPHVKLSPIKLSALEAMAEREYGREADGSFYKPVIEPKDIAAPEEAPVKS